ncbi:MAG: prepilin-type N-terminal cleavage/methylation domain-containing protein, partial [Candidatus Babeliales bacterium]
MKMRHAFTLLEMILAMALSSVIIVGLLQLQRSLTNNFSVAQNLMIIDRKVSLLFNQMEHDFTSAYIPLLEREKKNDKENAEAEKKANDQRKTFFVGAFKDSVGSVSKIDGKRVELLAYASFICTNPFQVVDERRQRLVRVIYELVVDKTKSTFDEP